MRSEKTAIRCFFHVLFPTPIGVLMCGALFLGEERLRLLIPLRS
jgi:hypothetical protein